MHIKEYTENYRVFFFFFSVYQVKRHTKGPLQGLRGSISWLKKSIYSTPALAWWILGCDHENERQRTVRLAKYLVWSIFRFFWHKVYNNISSIEVQLWCFQGLFQVLTKFFFFFFFCLMITLRLCKSILVTRHFSHENSRKGPLILHKHAVPKKALMTWKSPNQRCICFSV